MHVETRFRWPADGAPFIAVQDALASMGRERVVSELMPVLHGRSAVVVWLVLGGADATTVEGELGITEATLRGMSASIIDAIADGGDTVILPELGEVEQ